MIATRKAEQQPDASSFGLYEKILLLENPNPDYGKIILYKGRISGPLGFQKAAGWSSIHSRLSQIEVTSVVLYTLLCFDGFSLKPCPPHSRTETRVAFQMLRLMEELAGKGTWNPTAGENGNRLNRMDTNKESTSQNFHIKENRFLCTCPNLRNTTPPSLSTSLKDSRRTNNGFGLHCLKTPAGEQTATVNTSNASWIS